MGPTLLARPLGQCALPGWLGWSRLGQLGDGPRLGSGLGPRLGPPLLAGPLGQCALQVVVPAS